MTFEEARDKYAEMKDLHNSLIIRMEDVRKMRDKLCPHTDSVAHTEHFPGSYYDRASWEEYTKCTVCGKRTSEKRVSTGGYG